MVKGEITMKNIYEIKKEQFTRLEQFVPIVARVHGAVSYTHLDVYKRQVQRHEK